jgi:hypothetical protein
MRANVHCRPASLSFGRAGIWASATGTNAMSVSTRPAPAAMTLGERRAPRARYRPDELQQRVLRTGIGGGNLERGQGLLARLVAIAGFERSPRQGQRARPRVHRARRQPHRNMRTASAVSPAERHATQRG